MHSKYDSNNIFGRTLQMRMCFYVDCATTSREEIRKKKEIHVLQYSASKKEIVGATKQGPMVYSHLVYTHLVYYPFGLQQYAPNSHFPYPELIPIPKITPTLILIHSILVVPADKMGSRPSGDLRVQ